MRAALGALSVSLLATIAPFAAAPAGAATIHHSQIIVRATEEILRLVSPELREGALALGLPRWKVVLRIVIPTAGAGILTAVMLAVARGLGETAPILLTALGNEYINTNPNAPTSVTPLLRYSAPNARGHACSTYVSCRTCAMARGRFTANSCGGAYWQWW